MRSVPASLQRSRGSKVFIFLAHRSIDLPSRGQLLQRNVTQAGAGFYSYLLGDRFATGSGPHEAQIPEAPMAAGPQSSDAPVPETEEEIDDLGIEDVVIRELARALQPRRDR